MAAALLRTCSRRTGGLASRRAGRRCRGAIFCKCWGRWLWRASPSGRQPKARTCLQRSPMSSTCQQQRGCLNCRRLLHECRGSHGLPTARLHAAWPAAQSSSSSSTPTGDPPHTLVGAADRRCRASCILAPNYLHTAATSGHIHARRLCRHSQYDLGSSFALGKLIVRFSIRYSVF